MPVKTVRRIQRLHPGGTVAHPSISPYDIALHKIFSSTIQAGTVLSQQSYGYLDLPVTLISRYSTTQPTADRMFTIYPDFFGAVASTAGDLPYYTVFSIDPHATAASGKHNSLASRPEHEIFAATSVTIPISIDWSTELQIAVSNALKRLQEFADLPEDWDSYGASPISRTAVDRSRSLMLDIADRVWRSNQLSATPSFLAPVADGGVQLEWDGRGGHLEVEIGPHALLSYLFVQETGSGKSFEEQHDVSNRQIYAKVARALGVPADA